MSVEPVAVIVLDCHVYVFAPLTLMLTMLPTQIDPVEGETEVDNADKEDDALTVITELEAQPPFLPYTVYVVVALILAVTVESVFDPIISELGSHV